MKRGRNVVALVLVLACSSAVSHPYAARRFDPARACVDRTTTIDVVDGAEAANCAVVCMISGALDAGPGLFVSLMCAPYPPGYDTSGKDPLCKPAIEAFNRGDTCLADGGSENPIEAGPDAGPGDAAAE